MNPPLLSTPAHDDEDDDIIAVRPPSFPSLKTTPHLPFPGLKFARLAAVTYPPHVFLERFEVEVRGERVHRPHQLHRIQRRPRQQHAALVLAEPGKQR